MNTQKKYWESRFQEEEKIWGNQSSQSAKWAHQFFQKRGNVKRVLVLGAGYGRNSRFFSQRKYDVSGIEISTRALKIAVRFDPVTNFYQGSILDLPSIPELNNIRFDAVYGFNVLHLFLKEERKNILTFTYNLLKSPGYAVFTVFSDKEESIGKGKYVEYNTFESKPGRPVHYFTEKDLHIHFKYFQIIETKLYEETENHGRTGFHIHKLYYIALKKP
ncbi:MAG: Methyltransferase, type 11 [Promethearchaeota archaeon]|nr:MAG: Methyltransferase, type 11 [Candidatus Lokiarchaeota archaeon]